MNIFLVGCRTRGRVESQAGAAALRALAAELAPLDPEAIETWESPGANVVVTAIGHPSEQLSFSYSYFERSRMALFAGRPILWEATGEASGRGALDPRYYLAPSEQWMHALDGRCTVVRYDDAAGVLDIYSDLLGAYPVYWAKGGDGTLWWPRSSWSSNRTFIFHRGCSPDHGQAVWETARAGMGRAR